MSKSKPHRRLPKPRRANPVLHAMGVSAKVAAHRTNKPRPPGAVTAGELERDVLAFLAKHYADRHLDIEVAQLGLSNVAQRLIVTRLQSVAGHAIARSDRRERMRLLRRALRDEQLLEEAEGCAREKTP